MINFLKKILNGYKLKKGFQNFNKTGITQEEAYLAMRKMFVLTAGKSNDKMSERIKNSVGKYQNLKADGVLGKLSDGEIKKMVSRMNKDGYFIFPATLTDEEVKQIYQVGVSTPCNYLEVSTNDYSKQKTLFDPQHPVSPRYQFDNSDIINAPVIQKLLFDQSLLAFAQEYLGVKPILDLVAFWWSLPFNGEAKSAAAQMYHFDLDRIKFLKFFFYITDVDTDTGPHCYVKGSQQTLPKALSRDGRFTDEEIEATYGHENMIEICGKKGTIIAVDTRGFHKGKELVAGQRLLFQIEFANSMFGQTYPPVKITFQDKQIEKTAIAHPYSYQSIFDFEAASK